MTSKCVTGEYRAKRKLCENAGGPHATVSHDGWRLVLAPPAWSWPATSGHVRIANAGGGGATHRTGHRTGDRDGSHHALLGWWFVYYARVSLSPGCGLSSHPCRELERGYSRRGGALLLESCPSPGSTPHAALRATPRLCSPRRRAPPPPFTLLIKRSVAHSLPHLPRRRPRSS